MFDVNGIFADQDKSSVTSATVAGNISQLPPSAFHNCKYLKTITLPDTLTDIGNQAFQGCSSLTTMDLSKTKITSLGTQTFYGCRSLVAITLPESLVTLGNGVFWQCTALTSVTFGKNLVTMGNNTFNLCTSLTDMVLPVSLSSLGEGTFAECHALTSVVFPATLTTVGGSTFQAILRTDEDPNARVFITIYVDSQTHDSARTIRGHLGPQGRGNDIIVRWNGVGLYKDFYPNNSELELDLRYLTVKTFNNSVFEACSSLTTIHLPQSLTSLGDNTFMGCTALTTIDLPDSLTSRGSKTFYGCTNLESVTIPVTLPLETDDMFSGCTKLVSVVVRVVYNGISIMTAALKDVNPNPIIVQFNEEKFGPLALYNDLMMKYTKLDEKHTELEKTHVETTRVQTSLDSANILVKELQTQHASTEADNEALRQTISKYNETPPTVHIGTSKEDITTYISGNTSVYYPMTGPASTTQFTLHGVTYTITKSINNEGVEMFEFEGTSYRKGVIQDFPELCIRLAFNSVHIIPITKRVSVIPGIG